MTANTNNKHREETRDETRDRLLAQLNVLLCDMKSEMDSSLTDSDSAVLGGLNLLDAYTKDMKAITTRLRDLLEA